MGALRFQLHHVKSKHSRYEREDDTCNMVLIYLLKNVRFYYWSCQLTVLRWAPLKVPFSAPRDQMGVSHEISEWGLPYLPFTCMHSTCSFASTINISRSTYFFKYHWFFSSPSSAYIVFLSLPVPRVKFNFWYPHALRVTILATCSYNWINLCPRVELTSAT